MRKSIILFSAACLALFAAAFGGCGKKEKTVYTESGIRLEEHEDGYTVSGIGTYEGTQLSIPENFDGKPVTKIGEEAFSGCGQLEKVTVPGSVTQIGPSAFYGCSGLKEIELPESLTLIGNHAFTGSGLVGVSIPGSVTSLGDNAFRACKELTRAEVPGSVGKLRWNVFADCSALSEVALGEGIDEIEAYAFSYCGALREVALPAGVHSVDNYAFAHCGSLEELSLPQGLAEIGHDAFRDCGSLGAFSIPQSVSKIGENAFTDTAFYERSANWHGDALYLDGWLLKVKSAAAGELALEAGTRRVADRAAFGCEKLSSILVPQSVVALGKEAFANCTGLTSATLTDGVERIGYAAFSGCGALAQLTIPNSVKRIGDQAFYGCGQIQAATIPAFVIPLIAKTNLEKVVVTNGEKIETAVFSGAEKLATVILPDSITAIGDSAFSGCRSLKGIELPRGVREIGESAFSGCGLEEIALPEGLEEIAQNTFSSCASLRSIVIPDSVTQIGNSAFSGCVRLTRAKIGSKVKEIAPKAFENCYRLIEVWNRSELTFQVNKTNNGEISHYAKAIYSADEQSRQTVTSDGFLFYEDEEGAILLDYYENAVEFSLPDHSPNGRNYVVYQKSFYERKDIISVSLGEGVTKIGKEAFSGCSQLTDVAFCDSLTEIGEKAFYNCPTLTTVTLGEGVTKIGKEAFSGCSQLTDVAFCDSLTEIGARAFYQCFNFTSVVLSNGVTTVGDEAFYNCLNLTTVTLGGGVTKIGTNAFGNCYKLIEVCNLSELSVTEGGKENGRVAEYAKYVYGSGEESRQIVKDEFLFYENGEECFLLGYMGEEVQITLPQTSPSGQKYAIYQYAFAESDLQKVIIPIGVSEIGEKSFMNCNELHAIYYTGGAAEWKETEGTSKIFSVAVYFFSEAEPTKKQWNESGRWWHYGEENEAVEWEKSKN